MKKIFATLLSVIISLFILCPNNILLAEGDIEELTFGPGGNYSNWTTERTGAPGEQSKTFYQYRDVKSWNTTIVKSTTFPTFYKTGTYSAGSYACGSHCAKWEDYVYKYDCNRNHSGDPLWDCTRAGIECPSGSYGCLRWDSRCKNNVTDYCTSTATGYYTPASWNNWSAWSASSVSQTTSREVRSKVFYSHMLKFKITYDLDNGVEKVPNPTEYNYGDEITLNDPVKVDYNFKGWEPTGVITSSDTGDKHFKAIWEKAVLSYSGSTFKKGDKASENALVPNSYYSDDYNYKYTPATNACEE